MLQPEYPLTWTCFGALYKGKSKASCSSQNIPLHGHVSGFCTKVSQKLHALARISSYMDMFRGFVQRQVKRFMFQPEYHITWTCFGALYKVKSKASCSSQNIPLHGHVSGLCTKVSQMLHALARISPYMDMCRGSVQRQVKSFMLQPEYPLTWTYLGALYKGNLKASCSSQNIPLHEHVSGLCTKVSQKLRALARISFTWTCFRALYKCKSKASCSSQNIPLHGHESGLCTKASQMPHALARISPYIDMCRGSVQRQVKRFMFQPEYPLTWTCFGALSGLFTKASQKLHALARISPYMDIFRGCVQRQLKSFMLQPEYPLT